MAWHAHVDARALAVPPAPESGVVTVAASQDDREEPNLAHWRAAVIRLIDDALDALRLDAERAFLLAHPLAAASLQALAHEAEEAHSVEDLSTLLDQALELISDPDEQA